MMGKVWIRKSRRDRPVYQYGKTGRGKENIGIRNVNQRIKLACGEQYGIIIESTPYQGSRFTIQLPIMREGEGNET